MTAIINESVIVRDEETLKLLIRDSVREGIREWMEEMRLSPDHWAHLRREYERARMNGNIVRRTLIGVLLTSALLFGYNAVTDHIAKAVSQHLDQRSAVRGAPADQMSSQTEEEVRRGRR